jgi:hypothetical protein
MQQCKSMKMEDDLNKNKMKDDLKKNESERRPHFFVEKLEWQPQKKWKTTTKKNGRGPKKWKINKTNWKTNGNKNEDDLNKNGRWPKKK